MTSSKAVANKACFSRRSILISALSTTAYAVAQPSFSAEAGSQKPNSAADFVMSVGVVLHLSRRDETPYAKFEKVVELLQDLGIMQLRELAVFQSNITRDHDYYQRVRKLVAMGYRFTLVCTDPTNPYVFCPPRRLPDIYDWCDGGIDILEGGNEPDLARRPSANPAVSAEHQRTLYWVVKNTPSLRNVTVASPSYIQKSLLLAEDISDAVDWINIHPYPGMEHPETNGPGKLLGFIQGAQRICGKKPVLISETGYHTALQTKSSFLPVSEAIKTRYLPRLLLWGFINGAQRSYIYELIDTFNNGPADAESHFGLASYDGTPKPSFWAVKRLIGLLSRPAAGVGSNRPFQSEVTGDTQSLRTAVFRRNDGSHLLFLWLGVSGWDPVARAPLPPSAREVVLSIDPSPRTVRAYLFQDDASLVESPISPADGRLRLKVSDQLTAVEIET